MLLVAILFVSSLCYDLAWCHAPMFDGTDKTLPKNLKDNTITDRIQEHNIAGLPEEFVIDSSARVVEKEGGVSVVGQYKFKFKGSKSRINQYRSLYRITRSSVFVKQVTTQGNPDVKADKSMSLFEGDIELTSQDKVNVDTSQTGNAEKADVDVNEVTSKRKAIRSRKKIWRSKTIPIQLTPELASARANILAVLKEIRQHSCLKFRDRDKGDRDWIKLVKKKGCWSEVGRQGGMQELSLGDGCNDRGIILHEMMHALGFWHEQSRTDRDKYINVLWNNIQDDERGVRCLVGGETEPARYKVAVTMATLSRPHPAPVTLIEGQQKNFNRYKAGQLDYVGGIYDFDSAMHYGNMAFSKNEKPTMIAIKDPSIQFGRSRSTLSKTDKLQLNSLYDCQSKDGGWSSWSSYGPCDLQCSMERERFCTSKNPRDCPGVDEDGIQKQVSRCDKEECNAPVHGNWGRWAEWGRCSTTCGQGYRTRSRVCDNPLPRYGGKICSGALVEVTNCKVDNCSDRKHRITKIVRRRKNKT